MYNEPGQHQVDPAAERYAYLRLQQLVKAGVLQGIPDPGAGGYSALWRQYSPQAVQAAHSHGVQDTSAYLREGGTGPGYARHTMHEPHAGTAQEPFDPMQFSLQHLQIPQSPLGAVQGVNPGLAPFEVPNLHKVPLQTGPFLFGGKVSASPKSAVLARKLSGLENHNIGGAALSRKFSAALSMANKGFMG